MNKLLRKTLVAGAIWLGRRYQSVSLELAKIEAATAYVKTIKNVRLAAMAAIGLMVVVTLLVVSLFCAVFSLLWILPITPFAKGLSFLIFSAALFVIALAAILIVLSQKLWMKKTKADQLVRDATLRILRRKHA